MYLELAKFTPLWHWYYSGAASAGFIISALIAAMVIGLGNWRANGIFFKTVLGGAAVATLPLGLAAMGITMAISDPEMVATLSIVGTATSLILGVPYLVIRTFVKKGTSNQDLEQNSNRLFNTQVNNSKEKGLANDFDKTIGPKPENSEKIEYPSKMSEVEFTSGSRRGESVVLRNGTMTVGRSLDNDIVIADPSVSRTHAKITNENGKVFIEDLGSMNGTKLNGTPIKKELIDNGSSIQLGKVKVAFGAEDKPKAKPDLDEKLHSDKPLSNTVMKSVANQGWLAIDKGNGSGQAYQLKQGKNLIGRQEACDLILDDPYVSRQHALITLDKGKASIVDIGSRTGIKINGSDLEKTTLSPGKEFSVGETLIKLIEVDSQNSSDAVQDPTETLHMKKNSKTIVAIVTSGKDAGKSFNLNKGTNLIGRSSECKVLLTDETVSRQHAQIIYANGKLFLSDLGSSRGTKIDNILLADNVISKGDVVTIGQTVITMMGAAA